ncbi:OLC1v1001270C1 [Oldenlandia corymbosa var. corymbosa]|uniref:OLC1v1001270C1 n=1 Tax=Oldenlandia corymbosa var. corymbosa TaxID=529605 RepID=A0AAV1D617_OLDCO|nr:OLC1v1001270C1 [Oldenlandia corymbosa var. corymbosa]
MEANKSIRVSDETQNGILQLSRRWDEMSPELLSIIFRKIGPVDEMVRSVSLVCRGWLETVAGPDCWEEIELQQWCRSHWNSTSSRSDGARLKVDSVVRRLVRWSKCTFKKLSASRLGDAGFSYVSNCGRCLKILHIPVSEITDQMVIRHARSLVSLTELDISYCFMITFKGLEAFGKQCKSLTHLKRNMPPLESCEADDKEALTIANTMARLQHLEFEFGRLTDVGVSAIFSECEALSYLSIHGCWNVMLEGDLEERSKKLLLFIRPYVFDRNDSEGLSENEGTEADSGSEEEEYVCVDSE